MNARTATEGDAPSFYLDNAATSWPKPEEVCCAVEHFMRCSGGTPARGRHLKAAEAGRILDDCRRRLARLLGAGRSHRLVLTSGATESLNLALKGWLPPRAHVVVTDLEHNSVFRPLAALARDREVAWTIVPSRADGSLDPSAIRAAIRPRTRLVVVSHASNVLGTKVDLGGIAEACRGRKVPLLVDAAQTAGVVPLATARLGVDLLAFTGHKSLLGPSGTGGLLMRDDLELTPLIEGGTGTFSEVPEQPSRFPERYESGSPNMVGIAGLLAAVGVLEQKGVASLGKKKAETAMLLREKLREIPGVRLYGSGRLEDQVGIVAFNVGALPAEEAADRLWERGRIMVRAGLHCAPHLHGKLGTRLQGVVRVGIGYATPPDHVHFLAETIRGIAREAPSA